MTFLWKELSALKITMDISEVWKSTMASPIDVLLVENFIDMGYNNKSWRFSMTSGYTYRLLFLVTSARGGIRWQNRPWQQKLTTTASGLDLRDGNLHRKI